ncbi:hypothetical protein F5884DRAFT_769083 [Xylogone sp. PMI_703]|nr:hypothetical protein F5884DRAFT_769083 [Xylogone sp. PMI_703]
MMATSKYQEIGNLPEAGDYFSPRQTSKRHDFCIRILIATSIFFGFLSAVLAGLLYNAGVQCIDKGLMTELEPMKSAIEIVNRRFTGSLKYDENGTLYRDTDPTEPQYVGEPGPAIDKAWHDLLDGLYIGLNGYEARTVMYKTGIEKGGYLVSTDVMHTLHCLNEVRKAMYPDYYKVAGKPGTHQLHVEHCLDYVRQSIQCNADLTTMTFNYAPNRGQLVADFDTLHTCRNFDLLHSWAVERAIRYN